MIEAHIHNLRLRVELNIPTRRSCLGSYYIVLLGASETDKYKAFQEYFIADSQGLPFYTLADAAYFAEEMAAFWKWQLLANPRLSGTGIRELGEAWRKLAIEIYPSHRGYNRGPVLFS